MNNWNSEQLTTWLQYTVPLATLAAVLLIVVFAGFVLLKLPTAHDLEIQKVRFAAATFTGILLVFMFAAVLYFADFRTEGNAGRDIFDKALTAMTPLIGVIVGYLFGTRERPGGPQGGPGGGGGGATGGGVAPGDGNGPTPGTSTTGGVQPQ